MNTAPLILEVIRGRTRFPRRMVCEGNYLIGADADCDLRLGGDDVPPLHSVIHLENTGIWLERLSDGPELRVNGDPVRLHRLENGDRFAIGEFEFLARRPEALDQEAEPPADEPWILPMLGHDESGPLEHLAELSALELVELIEQEQAEVREFETRRAAGAAALLQAVHAQIVEQRTDSTEGTDAVRSSLDERARALRQQEALFAATAAQLLEAQQHLASQIDDLLAQLETLQPGIDPRRLRASA